MIRQLLLTVFFLSFSLSVTANNWPTEPFEINQEQIKYIYDGDTFFLVCPGCKSNKQGVRVIEVDTAEMKGHCAAERHLARQAKQFTVEKLRKGKKILLIPNPERQYDKYGRLLAWVNIDGFDLAEMLIDNKLGRKYTGGKRLGWCNG